MTRIREEEEDHVHRWAHCRDFQAVNARTVIQRFLPMVKSIDYRIR